MKLLHFINSKIQFIAVLAGFVFAVSMVFIDFVKFYEVEGAVFKFKDCVLLNPLLTPCFWGTVMFAFCLFIAGLIFFKNRRDLQKTLTIMLLLGVIFAWSNFIYTLLTFFQAISASKIAYSCTGEATNNPLLTPCFGGTVFYTAAYLIARCIDKPLNIE